MCLSFFRVLHRFVFSSAYWYCFDLGRLGMVPQPQAKKKVDAGDRNGVSEEERGRLLWSLDPFLFHRIHRSIRSVRALFLIVLRYLCRISARAFSLSLSRSVLLALDWLEKSASFSGRFFHRSEQGDASKFDESKCARLARLDYYLHSTRDERPLCADIESRTYADERLKTRARARRLKLHRLFGAIELSIATRDRISDKDGSKMSNSAGGENVLEKSKTIHPSWKYHSVWLL